MPSNTGSSSPIVVTGLTNGVTYTATVHATNAIGNSVESVTSAPFTPSASATAPGAPTIGTATAGDTTATANWTAPGSNGGSAITGYQIKTYDSSGTLLATDTTGVVLTYTKTALTNGTAVKFKVAAINAIGTGTQSAFSNTVTPAGVTWTPASLTDLKWWGEDLPLANNAFVSSWTNLAGGTALNGVIGTAPVQKTGILDGLSVVRFAGAGQLYQNYTLAQPCTFIIVGRTSDLTTDQSFCDGSSFFTAAIRVLASPVKFEANANTNPGLRLNLDNGWHVFVVVFNGASSKFYIDGGAGVTGQAGAGTPGGLCLGGFVGSSGLIGDIYGGIAVNHAMTAAEINQAGPYFVAKAPTTLPAWSPVS